MSALYERQLIMKEIGPDGQSQLGAARVLVVGAGGLGSPVIYYLAAAGVGHIGICDGDTVTLSNLNRQILHFRRDIGVPKTASAKEKITAFAPDITVTTYDFLIDDMSAAQLFTEYDVVVSCVDNIAARHILNRAHIKTKTPLIDAGVSGFSGYILPVISGYPCYSCVFPDDVVVPESARGILGACAGAVGSMQAAETVKTILGLSRDFYGHMLLIDLFDFSFQTIRLSRNPSCICATGTE
jgi:molybdopterin/thiamine biosynthesis adenylyltransferase